MFDFLKKMAIAQLASATTSWPKMVSSMPIGGALIPL